MSGNTTGDHSSFNSKVVRLKVLALGRQKGVVNEFQFQSGAVKSLRFGFGFV